MGDPTPLLSQPNNTSDTKTSPNKHLHSLGFTIEKCIGELNWSQFFQAVLISFAWIFDAQQTFITVFTDAVPSWHCTGENIDILNGCYSTPSFNDVCKFPKGSWAWDGPPQASIISEWAMQCESSIITGLPASMFFMGCLVGGTFLSTLADSSSLGRKNMLFFSTLLMALSSFFTAFSPNIWIYSLLKFLSGFGRATIGTSSLVLASELVGKRWRAIFCLLPTSQEPEEIGRRVRDNTVERRRQEATMGRTTSENNGDGDDGDERQQQQYQRWEIMAEIRDYENME